MRYYSRKDRWLSILIWGIVIGPLALLIYSWSNKEITNIEVALISSFLLVLNFFILWSWYSTYYLLEEKCLVIKYGPFKKIIPYDTILSVQKTANPLASPALSMKRIEIMYDRYNMTLISPRDRDHFMILLQDVCPQMEVKTKMTY